MIINLFGGPGCGKSTLALGLGHELKRSGLEVAVITEEAKPYALRGEFIGAVEQLEIMYQQYRNESKYYNLCDFIITDSPLELQAYYHYLRTGGFCYAEIVNGLRQSGPARLNYLLCREQDYDLEGRFQTEEEARQIDNEIRRFLTVHLCIEGIETKTHDPKEFITEYLA